MRNEGDVMIGRICMCWLYEGGCGKGGGERAYN